MPGLLSRYVRTFTQTCCIVGTVCSVGFLPAPTAHAQDWGVDGGDARRDEIISRYRTILEARPERGAIFDRLLQELGGGRRFDAAVEDYQRLAEERPDRFAYPMLLGHLLAHAERLEPALEAYGQAIEIAPEDSRGYVARAAVYRSLDRRDEAQQDYERALELATDDDVRRDVLQALADLAFDAREWEIASDYVHQILEIDDDAYVRAELAQIYIRYERFDEALVQYEAIADAAGRNTRERAIAIKDAGDVLAMMGRTEEALERYEDARRLVDDGHWLVRELEQRIIEAYRQDDRLDELVAQYETEWRRPSLRQQNLLAELYDELGREDEALETYRTALARDPRSIDTRLALIRMLERRGEMEEVVSQYQDLSRIDRNDASIRFRLVDVYRRLGRRDEAVAVLQSMSRTFASRAHVLIDIADRYARLGENEAALATYERLVRVEPSAPENHIALGEFHFMEGRRSEAERHWRNVLDIVEPRAQAHAMLGDVFADHGLIEEAILEYEEARSLAPEDDMILRAMAKLYEDAQQLTEALRDWERLALRTDQPHMRGEARTAMIRLYEALGRLRDVLPEYQDRFVEGETEAGYFLGAAWLALDDVNAAETVYQDILARDGDNLTALLALEDLFTEQHRHTEAVDVLLRVAEAHPSRAREYYHRLSELSLRLYDDAQAVRFAELAVELNPDNAQAHARLADIHRQMQNFDEAVLAYRQALLLDARAFPVYFDLAEVFLALDRPLDADALYQHVLDEANDEVAIVRAGRRSIQINQARDGLEPLISIIEPHIYDADTGHAYLKLLIEVYERLTLPLSQTMRFGAVDAREAAAARLEVIGRRALRPLLDALSSDDMTLRRTALRVLSTQRNPNAALPIARLLDSPDSELRAEAALAVAVMADERTAVPLARAAREEVGVVQALSAWALSRLDDPTHAALLEEVARDEGVPAGVRAFALRGLGHVGAAPELIREGLLSEAELVQVASALAVGEMGDEDAGDTLRLLLAHGRASVPLAAASALASLPPSTQNVRALAEAFVHGARDIRIHAAAALGRLASARTGPRSPAEYDDSLVFYDREANALDAAAYFDGLLAWGLTVDGAATRDALAPFYQDLFNAYATGMQADVPTQLALLEALTDGGDLAPAGVSDGLAPEAREAHHDAVQTWLVEQMDTLILLTGSDDPRLRATAYEALGYTDERATEALTMGFVDRNDAAAVAALRSAGRLRADVASGLIAMLHHAAWRRREAAAQALVDGGYPEGTHALESIVVLEPFASVREAALLGLMQTAPQRAAASAGEAWDELPVTVRLAATRAAAASPETFGEILSLAREDADRRVRAAAE